MSPATLQSLLRELPFSVAVLDRRGRIVSINAALERRTRRSAGELIGLSLVPELLRGLPDTPARLQEGLDRGSVDLRFVSTLTADDPVDARDCRVRVRSFRDGGRAEALALLEFSEPAEAEDGAHARTATGVLRRVARTKHTLNNLLMGLMGHAEMLLGIPDLPEEGKRRAEAILNETRRLRETVQSIDLD